MLTPTATAYNITYPSTYCDRALPLIEQNVFSEVTIYVDPTYGILHGIELTPRSSPQMTPDPSFLPQLTISDADPKCENEVLQEVKDVNSRVPQDQRIQLLHLNTVG
jgi:hypothetical protein